MEMKELRDLESEELVKKEKELRKELFNLRYQILSEQISNPQRVKEARREIARVKTVLKEKKTGQPTTAATSPEGK